MTQPWNVTKRELIRLRHPMFFIMNITIITILRIAAMGLLTLAILQNLGPAHAAVWAMVFLAGTMPIKASRRVKGIAAAVTLLMPLYYSIIGGWKVFFAALTFYGIEMISIFIAARVVARKKGFQNLEEYTRHLERTRR